MCQISDMPSPYVKTFVSIQPNYFGNGYKVDPYIEAEHVYTNIGADEITSRTDSCISKVNSG